MRTKRRLARVILLATATTLGLTGAWAQTPPAAIPPAVPPSDATAKDAPPRASPAEAEITFWNSIKDSRNPAEFKAYLDTYPNGTFAALARLRMSALSTPTVAPKPATPASPPSAASAITSPNIVREIHDKLYNLNYRVGPATERMTPELREAITNWQRRLNRPITGDLNADDLSRLRAAVPPSTWGALAYSAGGASQTVARMPNRMAAETTALAGCRKNTRSGQCDVVTAALKGCGALAHSSGIVGDTRHMSSYAAVRDTLVEASDSAMADCRARSRVPGSCKIRTVFCADGSHVSTPAPSPPAPATKPKSGLQL